VRKGQKKKNERKTGEEGKRWKERCRRKGVERNEWKGRRVRKEEQGNESNENKWKERSKEPRVVRSSVFCGGHARAQTGDPLLPPRCHLEQQKRKSAHTEKTEMKDGRQSV
jgi:hypothetical protein